eukprot:SAG31_NODE_551_length_14207_cov_7.887440_5_plen_586_part_00
MNVALQFVTALWLLHASTKSVISADEFENVWNKVDTEQKGKLPWRDPRRKKGRITIQQELEDQARKELNGEATFHSHRKGEERFRGTLLDYKALREMARERMNSDDDRIMENTILRKDAESLQHVERLKIVADQGLDAVSLSQQTLDTDKLRRQQEEVLEAYLQAGDMKRVEALCELWSWPPRQHKALLHKVRQQITDTATNVLTASGLKDRISSRANIWAKCSGGGGDRRRREMLSEPSQHQAIPDDHWIHSGDLDSVDSDSFCALNAKFWEQQRRRNILRDALLESQVDETEHENYLHLLHNAEGKHEKVVGEMTDVIQVLHLLGLDSRPEVEESKVGTNKRCCSRKAAGKNKDVNREIIAMKKSMSRKNLTLGQKVKKGQESILPEFGLGVDDSIKDATTGAGKEASKKRTLCSCCKTIESSMDEAADADGAICGKEECTVNFFVSYQSNRAPTALLGTAIFFLQTLGLILEAQQYFGLYNIPGYLNVDAETQTQSCMLPASTTERFYYQLGSGPVLIILAILAIPVHPRLAAFTAWVSAGWDRLDFVRFESPIIIFDSDRTVRHSSVVCTFVAHHCEPCTL